MIPSHLLLALLPTSTISLDIAHLPEDTDLIPELSSSSCSPYNLSSPGVSRSCVSLFISTNRRSLCLGIDTGRGEKGKRSLHWLI